MYVYIMCIGQRVRSRSWSHSGKPGTASVTTKKKDWTETSEASQEEEEEEEGEGEKTEGEEGTRKHTFFKIEVIFFPCAVLD